MLIIIGVSMVGLSNYINLKKATSWHNFEISETYTIQEAKSLIDESLKEKSIAQFVRFRIIFHKANAPINDATILPPLTKEYFNLPTEKGSQNDYDYLALRLDPEKFLIKIDVTEQNLIFSKMLEFGILDLKNPIDQNLLDRRICGLEVFKDTREVQSKDFIGININRRVFLDTDTENKKSIKDFVDWFENRYNSKLLEKKDGEYVNIFDRANIK